MIRVNTYVGEREVNKFRVSRVVSVCTRPEYRSCTRFGTVTKVPHPHDTGLYTALGKRCKVADVIVAGAHIPPVRDLPKKTADMCRKAPRLCHFNRIISIFVHISKAKEFKFAAFLVS